IDTVPLAYDLYEPTSSFSSSFNNSPIIFLHGLFGNKLNNRASSRQLSKLLNKSVYALDLRNHGLSPHANRNDTPSLAADVENFIIENKLNKPIVIGHSMGAKAAMAISLRRPNLLSQVISVDNVPAINTKTIDEFEKFAKYIHQLKKITTQITPKPVESLEEADHVLSSVESDRLIRQFVLTNIKRDYSKKNIGHTPLVLHSRIPLEIILKNLENIRSWEFDSKKSTWNGPTLLVRGLKSKFVPNEDLPKMKQFFPNYDLASIDSGHWIISEKHQEFINVVGKWIKEH
ncbi:hypothetical protein PACTADRAFT_23285, partial [Pachysolen tannophilus NRRL Y-2460]